MTRLRVFQPRPDRDRAAFALLDQIEIPVRCEVPWDGMRGDDRVRFCDRCHQNVYNIAAMSRVQALALIQGGEGRQCLRLTRRADRTVTTADCRTLLRQARRRGLLPFAGMLFVLLWAEIAAQIVGLWALGRVLRTLTQGLDAQVVTPVPRPAPVVPPPPDVIMGEPPALDSVIVGRLRRAAPLERPATR
jgi:hypothetical protein